MPEDMKPELPPLMTDDDIALAQRRLKYRFWLAVLALVLAAVFASFALGSFTAGQGLAMQTQNSAQADQTILIFNVLGGVFIALTVGAMWLTYKLRPGGD